MPHSTPIMEVISEEGALENFLSSVLLRRQEVDDIAIEAGLHGGENIRCIDTDAFIHSVNDDISGEGLEPAVASVIEDEAIHTIADAVIENTVL